jgi:hypothetical protein
MTWFEEHLGIDGVDLAVQVAVTGIGVAITRMVFSHDVGIVLAFKVVAGSLLLFAWRRHRALRRRAPAQPVGLTSGEMTAQRLEEMEQRLGELEGAQARVAELEERLDFAERLLARADAGALLSKGEHRG